MPRFGARELFMRRRHRTGRSKVVAEHFFEAAHGAIAIFRDDSPIKNMREEEALQLSISSRDFLAEAGQAFWRAANIVDALDAGILNALDGRLDQIRGENIQNAFQRLIKFQFASS